MKLSSVPFLWRVIQGPDGLVTEHRFDPARRWRFDFAHPASRVAIEIEGGVWTGGRHTRGKGFIGDLEKYNAAALAGWAVFRFTPQQITAKNIEKVVEFALERCK